MTSLRDRFRAVAALVMAVFALAFASQAYAFDHPSATASPPGFELLLADLPSLSAADQLSLEYECAQTRAHTYFASSGGLEGMRSASYTGATLTRAVNGEHATGHPLIE